MRRGSLAFTVVLASGGHISTPAIQVYNTTALHLLPQDEAASCNLAGRSSIPWPPMQGPPMHPHTGLQDILGLQRGLPVGNPSHYGDVLPRSSGGSITSNGPPTQESTRILPSSNPSTGNCIQNERVTDQAGQFVKVRRILIFSYCASNLIYRQNHTRLVHSPMSFHLRPSVTP